MIKIRNLERNKSETNFNGTRKNALENFSSVCKWQLKFFISILLLLTYAQKAVFPLSPSLHHPRYYATSWILNASVSAHDSLKMCEGTFNKTFSLNSLTRKFWTKKKKKQKNSLVKNSFSLSNFPTRCLNFYEWNGKTLETNVSRVEIESQLLRSWFFKCIKQSIMHTANIRTIIIL